MNAGKLQQTISSLWFVTLIVLLPNISMAQNSSDEISREDWMEEAKSNLDQRADTTNNRSSGVDTIPGINPANAQSLQWMDSNGDTLTAPKDEPGEIVPRPSADELKFFGDHSIGKDEVYNDNIRIIGGTLTVDGKLNGRATVIGGDIFLHDHCVVNGDIVALGGSIHQSDLATVNGKVIETNLQEGLVYREQREPEDDENWDDYDGDFSFDFHQNDWDKWDTQIPEAGGIFSYKSGDWIHPQLSTFNYNRNEGFVLAPLNERWDRDGESSFRLSISLGYRFGDQSPIGKFTLEKSFFKHNNLVFFGSLYQQSRTNDYYRLPEGENSAAGFFGRQDFQDRWNETGWKTGAAVNLLGGSLIWSIAGTSQDSMAVVDLWSLANRERLLRPNLSVTEGEYNFHQLVFLYRTPHYHPLHTGLALHLNSEWIQDTPDPGALFDPDINWIRRTFVSTTLNLEITPGIVIHSRGIVGSSDGSLPGHRMFGVGGLGSVAAHGFKEQRGDQMVLGNLALMFTPGFLKSDWLISLQIDGGHAWLKDAVDYALTDFTDYQDNTIRSITLGVGDPDKKDVTDWMVYVSKSLIHEKQIETTFRFNLNF